MKHDPGHLKKTLYTGLICDVLDHLGHRNQSLGGGFRGLGEDTVLFGKAFTSIGTQVYAMPANPLTAQCKVIDRISEGEIYVLATRGERNCAIFGELLATAIQAKKGAGALIDGMARDLRQLKRIGFPLFHKGSLPTTSKGRCEVTECQTPILIDGVAINPGDYIFADLDGVAVIPAALADQVFDEALVILGRENNVRAELLNGASLEDTYAKIGAI
ncbi:MAG: hypothetical protein LBU64_14455 [Planctomycetota bacterium]|jgi:regulator of RNase E activity RraA|nr:hypothetical protein [Planctomycetota bacterium]